MSDRVGQSDRSPDATSREGFKLLGEHIEDCCALRDGEPFVITAQEPFDFRRKKNGQRGGSTMWWRFCCNDIRCRAILLVRWDQIMHFINGTEA